LISGVLFMNIHKTSIIHPKAQIENNVIIGPYCIIAEHVRIYSGTILEGHVFIDKWTEIGENCHIFPFASLGTPPQDYKYKGEKSKLIIGRGTIIRESVMLSRGSEAGGGVTRIGENCMLMAYSHVAHDCQLGNRVILANSVAMAGHVTINDNAIIGGLSCIHQFARIGDYAFVGGASAVSKDVSPYGSAVGNRARLFGINLIGLQRNGFSPETISKIKRAYRFLLSSEFNISDAIKKIETEEEIDSPEVRHLIDFIKSSSRGICI